MTTRPLPARGFTLLELIIVICVLSTLGVVAADHLSYYEEQAEKAAVQYNVEAFKMGLRIRAAEMMAANHGDDLATLEDKNPVQWLESAPPGYAGEYRGSPVPGNWYFESARRELVYIPKNHAHLKTQSESMSELRFRVAVNRDSASRAIVGVGLVPASEFKWF